MRTLLQRCRRTREANLGCPRYCVVGAFPCEAGDYRLKCKEHDMPTIAKGDNAGKVFRAYWEADADSIINVNAS